MMRPLYDTTKRQQETHKLVRDYEATDASVHDSQVVDGIIDPNNTNADAYADRAYRSVEQEQKFKKGG